MTGSCTSTGGGRAKMADMRLRVKRFDELTVCELYEILKLRIDVFVVEQNCPYREADNMDQAALHVFLKDEDGVQAYLRVMDRGVESEHVSIGRVIASKRGCGLGKRILQEGIAVAKERFDARAIYLEAQVYAEGFYETAGFRRISDPFDIDGIPHIKMLRAPDEA